MDAISFNSRAYTKSRCDAQDPRFPVVLPMIGTNRDVLDLGCLDGTVGALFVAQGNRVSGIDASRTAIERARERGLDARLGNLDDALPFADAAFDVAFAGEIVEHVFEIDPMLSEVYRVLRPGGTLIVTTPNLAALGRRLLLLVNRNPHIEISFTGNAAGHIRYFIRSTLESLLTGHGFAVRRFTSDVVNLNAAGSRRSRWLARLAPTLGKTLIVEAVKIEAPSHRGG
jgi:SAM-dependent methyltransferase